CTNDNDCLPSQTCTNNVCVTASMGMCTSDNDCAGQICENGMCVACENTGPRACAADEVCSPSGVCIPDDGVNPALPEGPEVQGGACVCDIGRSAPHPSLPWLIGLMLLGVVLSIRHIRPVR